MSTEPSRMERLWATVMVSVISSLIVGMGAAYFTAQITITRLEERVSVNTLNISANGVLINDLQKDRERLVRVETKIDMLLQGVGGSRDPR